MSPAQLAVPLSTAPRARGELDGLWWPWIRPKRKPVRPEPPVACLWFMVHRQATSAGQKRQHHLGCAKTNNETTSRAALDTRGLSHMENHDPTSSYFLKRDLKFCFVLLCLPCNSQCAGGGMATAETTFPPSNLSSAGAVAEEAIRSRARMNCCGASMFWV